MEVASRLTKTERRRCAALRRLLHDAREEIEEFGGEPDWEDGRGAYVRAEFAALVWALQVIEGRGHHDG